VNESWQDNSRPNKEAMASRSFLWRRVAHALIAALVALPGVGPSMQAQDTAATIAVDVKVVGCRHCSRQTWQDRPQPHERRFHASGRRPPADHPLLFAGHESPFTLGLLVDTSRSQTSVLDAERNAAAVFSSRCSFNPKTKLSSFTSIVKWNCCRLDFIPRKLQSRSNCSKRIGSREVERSQRLDNSRSGSDSHHAGGTQLYDAVFLASNELMKKRQGRRLSSFSRTASTRQQDLPGERDRVGPACRHRCLLHLLRGVPP